MLFFYIIIGEIPLDICCSFLAPAIIDPKTRKLSTSYHETFDEDMTSRRCALRDFDLRQTKKAGPSATADEEREAKLERSMYDESPDLKYEDQPNEFVEDP